MARNILLPRFFVFCALLFTLSACGDKGNNKSAERCTTRDDCAEGQRCSTDGVCTSESQSCEFPSDCGADEYCANGTCELRACTDDEQCVSGSICLAEQCQVGCREDDQCPDGESCSATNICEVAGCTTGSCPTFQSCDQSASPPQCVYTGDCSNDTHCAGYAQVVGDGNEYICSQAEQRCVIKPPCESDSDCQVGDICEPRATDGRHVCRSGCRSNDACRTGYICDLTALACAPGCASVSDCPSDGSSYACEDFLCVKTCETRNECATGQVCVGTPRRCGACRDDSECPANEFCDKELGSTDDEIANPTLGLCAALPPTCPADSYGNNHNQNVPFAITAPFDTTDDQPLFCRENANGEWFSFSAATGDVIEVRLDYDNSLGNLDIGLRREAGEELVASQAPPTLDQGSELIRFGVDLGGTFLVHVRGTLLTANANYNLVVDVNPAPACTADALEPNSATSPAVMPVDTDHVGLEVCGDDADFYTLNVGQNQLITVHAEAPLALGNIDLYLRDPSGVQIASAVTRQDKETIEVAVDAAGEYELEVRVTSGVGAVGYNIEWTQRDNNCADPFEPNDMCPSNPIAPGTYEGLNVCSDNDWYQVELLPLQTITVTATYDRAVSAGDLDLTLIGPNDCATLTAVGTETPVGTTTQVQERVQYQSESGGVYNVQVFLFSGVQAQYDLSIDVSDGPPCADDVFEPNDAQATATALDRAQLATGNDNVLAGLRVCDTNEDYYSVELQDGDEIEFAIQFVHARGDLDAELIGPSGVVATASSESDDEELSYTVPAGGAGTYFLKVKAKFAARNDYWVLVYLNGAGPTDPNCPDQFEDNDTRATAVPITPGNYSLLVCGAPVDEDWYTLPVVSGERVELTIASDGGVAELYLFDDTNSPTPVANTSSASAGVINYFSHRDQTLVMRVREVGGQARVPYNFAVTRFPTAVCQEDAFAGNTAIDLAAAVSSPGLYPRLMLCDGMSDWYEFDLTAGRVSEVFINFDGTRADLDLRLYDPSQALFETEDGTGNDASIEFTPDVTGTYYVEVYGKANARLNYDLLLYTDADGDGLPEGPEDRVCPDQFENNDLPAAAVTIPPGLYNDLLLCAPLDNDYYRVFVPAGATITARIEFDNDLGNINLDVRNGTSPFSVISTSTGSENWEEVAYHNTGGLGQYVLVGVTGAPGSGVFSNYYTLEIDLAFSDACVDDTNSGRSTATAPTLATGAYEMRMCEGAADYIALGNITSVAAHIEFKHEQADLDMFLLDANGVVVESTGISNTESIVESGLSGAHFLLIEPKGSASVRTDYDLWLSVNGGTPSVPYCPDRFERNDTSDLASELPLPQTRQIAGAIACGTEEDWYLTSNVAATTYELAMFYDHGAGADLDIAMWPITADPNTATPTVFIDTAADDAVQAVSLTAGRHYIRVRNTASNGVATPYDLLLGLPTMYTQVGQCPEDALEPNNNASSAKALGFPVATALGLCGNDDYFTFIAPTAGPVTVSIAFDASKFNAGLRVMDSSFNNIGVSFADVGNRESVTFTAAAGVEYAVAVEQSGGTTENGPYFLRIE